MTSKSHLSQGSRGTGARATACLAVAALLYLGTAPTGQAQDPDLQSLMQKVQRLQRELSTLQRHVFQGGAPQAAAQGATAGAEDIARPQAARLELRLTQFETELRTLTGQVEEQSYRLDQLEQKMDRLVASLEQRIQQATQAQAAGAPTAPAKAPSASTTPDDDGAPKVIGQITRGTQPATQAQSGAMTTTATNDAVATGDMTPEAKYKHAHTLLNQANYDGAQLALQAFLDEHPDNRLAGNAMYWLGETYYVRKRYDEAAVVFAEGFKNYPNGTKAPDNLLKLGKSLAALGSSADACGTFAVLLERYPKSSPTILQRARREQRALDCP